MTSGTIVIGAPFIDCHKSFKGDGKRIHNGNYVLVGLLLTKGEYKKARARFQKKFKDVI